ncbi:hypothetical protein CAPTEDRAFT_185110, partial [Capitella teleta]
MSGKATLCLQQLKTSDLDLLLSSFLLLVHYFYQNVQNKFQEAARLPVDFTEAGVIEGVFIMTCVGFIRLKWSARSPALHGYSIIQLVFSNQGEEAEAMREAMSEAKAQGPSGVWLGLLVHMPQT